MIERRTTRTIFLGGIPIGNGHPIPVQSMTKTFTEDLKAVTSQIQSLARRGCDIVRVAVPHMKAARCLDRIKAASPIPVVADIHFNYRLALEATRRGVDGIRINPGNMRDREGLRLVARAANERNIPIRIGVNSGSVLGPREKADSSEELLQSMVRQALEAVRFFEKEKFYDLKISVKTPEVALTMECYRRLARLCDYPLHIGLTAAGPLSQATMKNAMVIGGLLSEGIGDTIRVSLTGSPEEEVRLGICILQALGLRPRSTTILSCPTCGRCNIDLLRLVKEVEKRIREFPEGLEIAVMGCVVNGPGEARRADIGVAGGKGFGFIFRRGKRIRKVPQSRLVEALLEEAKNLR